jgi:hypothetical protein
MLSDPIINHKLDRYRIIEILNYIDKLTRGKSGYGYKRIVKLTDIVTKGKKHRYVNNKGKVVERDYAVFIVDSLFYPGFPC